MRDEKIDREEVRTVNKLSGIDWTALVLVIIGGLNWLLVGLFGFDLVASIFGEESTLARIIYIIVGLATLYLIGISPKLEKK